MAVTATEPANQEHEALRSLQAQHEEEDERIQVAAEFILDAVQKSREPVSALDIHAAIGRWFQYRVRDAQLALQFLEDAGQVEVKDDGNVYLK